MIRKRTARDFKFIRLLGEGSFSSVYLAVDADARVTNHQSSDPKDATVTATSPSKSPTAKRVRKYAIKVCQKSHIKRQGKQVAIMREKEILNILNQCQCKHFIRLYCTFQDMERLFFVMSYAENGELLNYMLQHPLSLDTVRKFTLQLVSALEQLHKLNIVHRDLKPENILLSELLDLLISDFGSAQIYNRTPTTPPQPTTQQRPSSPAINPTDETPSVSQTTTTTTNITAKTVNATKERRNSFVGTAQYVSPEMLKNREASNKSDLWALGVIVYQMITNVMPFDAPNEYLIYKKIQSLEFSYPDGFDDDARDLVNSLIKLEPQERIGANDDLQSGGYQSIRNHCFLSKASSEQVMTASDIVDDNQADPDLQNIDTITPGLDETQMLRLLTEG